MERLVGSRTLQRLKKQVLPAGLRDVQEWTEVTLTFIRRDPESGWGSILTLPVISIRLNSAQALEAIGGVETTTRGAGKVWASDVEETQLKPKDRFVWDGHTCVVTLVHPARLETYVAFEFDLLEA